MALAKWTNLILFQAIENLVRAWKDNTLEAEKYGFGLDSILSKRDTDSQGFHNDILSAIQFLQVNNFPT